MLLFSLEISLGLENSTPLFRPQGEGLCAVLGILRVGLDGKNSRLNVFDTASEPLSLFSVLAAESLESFALQHLMDIVVHEDGAVCVQGGLNIFHLIRLPGGQCRVVLLHAGFDRTVSITDLKTPGETGV